MNIHLFKKRIRRLKKGKTLGKLIKRVILIGKKVFIRVFLEKILMDNGILDEMDEGLKQARDNICNKNNKHEDFFIELKNIQTKAIKDPKICKKKLF